MSSPTPSFLPNRSVLVIVPGFPGPDDPWFAPPVSETVAALATLVPISVVSLYYPRYRQSYLWRGIPVTAFGADETTRSSRFAAVAHAVWHVWAKRPRPDAIMGVWATEPGLAAVLAGRLCDRSAVVSVAGGEIAQLPRVNYGDSRHWDRQVWIHKMLARADHVVVPSRWMFDQLQQRRWVDPTRLSECPWGIVPRNPPPAPRQSNTITLLTVAALLPVKGLDLLLAAMAQAQDSRLRLRCVGDGPCRASLMDQAHVLGLAERVEWVGWVPHDRVREHYAAADVFVHPSWWEAQGVAVLEAMAAGLPVISTDVGAAPEAIQMTGSGVLVKPGDVGALTTAINGVVENLHLWTDMARAQRLQVINRWGVQIRAKDLASLLCAVSGR